MSPAEVLRKGPVLGVIVAVAVIAAAYIFLSLNQHGWESNRALAIGIGGGLGWFMMLNVWGIVWRMQKKIIRWTEANASQGTPMPPEAPKVARIALLVHAPEFLGVVPHAVLHGRGQPLHHVWRKVNSARQRFLPGLMVISPCYRQLLLDLQIASHNRRGRFEMHAILPHHSRPIFFKDSSPVRSFMARAAHPEISNYVLDRSGNLGLGQLQGDLRHIRLRVRSFDGVLSLAEVEQIIGRHYPSEGEIARQ